jgi:hypothetical protein
LGFGGSEGRRGSILCQSSSGTNSLPMMLSVITISMAASGSVRCSNPTLPRHSCR